MSLDGVVEAPESWTSLLQRGVGGRDQLPDGGSDTLLLRRRTYQQFEAYWPHQTNDVPFADGTNHALKLVASTTFKEVG
jgi:hypothetical protein